MSYAQGHNNVTTYCLWSDSNQGPLDLNLSTLPLSSDISIYLYSEKNSVDPDQLFSNLGISRCKTFNSLLASSEFCRLLITFTDSLDSDQDRQNVCPDLDQNHLTL